jgi:transglutaminase-like putative cysteine protease
MKIQRIELPNLSSLVFRRIRPATGLSLALLLVSLSSIAYGLSLVIRGLSLALGLGLACTGLGLGWLLARSGLKARWSFGISALLGMAGLFLHLGGLLPDLFVLLRRTNQFGVWLVRDPLNSYRHMNQIRYTLAAGGELWNKLSVLVARLFTFIVDLATGSPAYDPLVTVLLWGLALWGAAAWAAWAVRRKAMPLASVIPGGVLLAASLGYSRADTFALLPMLGSALLLTALVQHLTRLQRWDTEGTDYSEALSLDIAMIAVPMAAMIVSAAAFAPNVSPRRISQLVQEAIRIPDTQVGDLGDSLGLRRQPLDDSLYDEWRSPGMPRSHLIGSGPELSQQIVMEIQSAQIQIPSEDYKGTLFETARLNYWRSRTYDIYTGYGWTTGSPEIITYQAGELARPPGFPDYESFTTARQSHATIIQEIKILGETKDWLYAVGTILTADQEYQVAWRRSDLSAGPDIFGSTITGSRYRVQSLVPIPDQGQLQESGSEYPAGIRARYLYLPATVTQRVQALALQLTAVRPTPYDRAVAIENYLRGFPYSLDVSLPPPGVDVVDYFLFDSKRGYCDFYATAMVILARSAGIPARLVLGYAGGSYDIDQGVTVVTEADAHSWAELYFPGIGWVEFEPTGGRPGLDTPTTGPPAALVFLEKEPFPTPYPGHSPWIWLMEISTILGVITLSFLVWQWLDSWRLGTLPPSTVVMQVYRRFYLTSKVITISPVAGETPFEYAARFASFMDRLAASKSWGKKLAVSKAQADKLTELYTWVVYSPHAPSQTDQKTAIQLWQQMRWRLYLLRIFPRSKLK